MSANCFLSVETTKYAHIICTIQDKIYFQRIFATRENCVTVPLWEIHMEFLLKSMCKECCKLFYTGF